MMDRGTLHPVLEIHGLDRKVLEDFRIEFRPVAFLPKPDLDRQIAAEPPQSGDADPRGNEVVPTGRTHNDTAAVKTVGILGEQLGLLVEREPGGARCETV